MEGANDYTVGVDFEFLEAMGIKIIAYQPWQLGLFHEELKGKFVWYPKAGTLMYEDQPGSNTKVGQSGDFVGTKEYITEKVYEILMAKLNQQYDKSA